jgi:hypothetical protein
MGFSRDTETMHDPMSLAIHCCMCYPWHERCVIDKLDLSNPYHHDAMN